MDILIDYDGTCKSHPPPIDGLEFNDGPTEEIGAVPVLQELVENGHRLILFTMRANMKYGMFKDMEGLQQAVNWFVLNGIPLYGIQKNPTQDAWTTSPKAYGQLIIDDTSLGIPLVEVPGRRPHVDWDAVRILLIERGIIKSTGSNCKHPHAYHFHDNAPLYCPTCDTYPEQ